MKTSQLVHAGEHGRAEDHWQDHSAFFFGSAQQRRQLVGGYEVRGYEISADQEYGNLSCLESALDFVTPLRPGLDVSVGPDVEAITALKRLQVNADASANDYPDGCNLQRLLFVRREYPS